MFTGLSPLFALMNRDTFINYLNWEYEIFKTTVVFMLKKEKENCFGLPFISICHDMWTTVLQDNVLVSSINFISADFEVVKIAFFLVKNNTTHNLEFNAITLHQYYLDWYSIDLDMEANFITSDTATAAKAVSNYVEDIEQIDCEMHLVNLAILYAIGLRENVETVTAVLETGHTVREKMIVTPRGAFEERIAIIKKLQLLAKYFGTGQRKQKLIYIQVRYLLLSNFPQMDGLTQVASCHRLLQTSMLHYFAMERYYRDAAIDNDMFTGLWDAITQDDWVVVQEIESLCFMLVNYALGKISNGQGSGVKKYIFLEHMWEV
jgi:hypothetical protein